MFRSTLVLTFLPAVLCVSSCGRSKPSQPNPAQQIAQRTNSATTSPLPPSPQPEASAAGLHRRWEIAVKAGPLARENVVVSVQLPGTPPINSASLREPNGARVPSQTQEDGQVVFRVKALKAGAQATYLAEDGEPEAASGKGGVLAVQAPDGVKLTVDGKPILTYQTRPKPEREDIPPEYWRNGYLHPIYSPAGVVVTDDYPKDRLYQHGIWAGWQKVEFEGSHPDLWDVGLKKGRAAMESVAPLWGGPLRGGFGSHQFFSNLDGGHPGATVLREGWSVTAFRDSARAPYTVLDLESLQEVLTAQTTLGENPFGGITLRGNRDWQGAGHSIFLTSEGQARTGAQGAPARWCYLGGHSSGKLAGVAILSHPQNSNRPEAVFIDPEEPVMGFAPSKNGPIAVRRGQPLKLKYRFVVLDGKPDSKLFERLWNDFANPPVVEARLLGSK